MENTVIENISSDTLLDIEKRLGDLVSSYTTIITKILPDDQRDPPGDLHGTGSYIEIDGLKFLLTCDHVSNDIVSSTLCASFHESDCAVSIRNPFFSSPYPADISISAITDNTWNITKHEAQAIPYSLFLDKHCPVANELMYLAGNPGEFSRIWPAEKSNDIDQIYVPGIQHYTIISVLCKIQNDFDPILHKESPQPLEDMHFLLPYNPESSTHLNQTGKDILPRAPGLSGSLVWNTRYQEITQSGGNWQPSDARVTGILWGNSTKANVLVVTPVEYIRQLIDAATKNISENRPYWVDLDTEN